MKCPRLLSELLSAGLLSGVLFSGPGCSGSIVADESKSNTGGGPNPGDPDIAPPEVPDEKTACSGSSTVSQGRWRRLTADQYSNAVRDLLGQTTSIAGFLPDSRTARFKTNAAFPVEEVDVGTYASKAEYAAKLAVGNLKTLLGGCDTAGTGGEDRCATRFIKDFGERAYRHPLSTDESAALMKVYNMGKAESFSVGIKLVVEAALQAPRFLYMVESGMDDDNGLRKLDGFEVASRLSFLLTGTMPDADLFAAARNGVLDTADGVATHARKMVDSPKFTGEVSRFHIELIGVDALADTTAVTKSTTKYPDFNDGMRTAMADEMRKFVSYVMEEGSGSVEELMSANYVFPSGPLAKVYGAGAVAGADGRAIIEDGTRKGLLTLAGTQAVHPMLPTPRGAVNRGHMVRRDFLCNVVPPPDVRVEFTLPPNAEMMTAQELLRAHMDNPTCKACHSLMDSIGFGFENYDPLGAYRTHDAGGNEIDATGEIVGIADEGVFNNAGEMVDKLAASPELRECMSTQWFRFAFGRDPEEADACTQAKMISKLKEGQGNIRDAVLSLVQSDAFRFKGGL